MKHLFFLFVGLFAVYETLKAFCCKKLYTHRREYRLLVKKDDKSLIEAFFKAHPKVTLASIFDLGELIMCISGLMTSQWILFISVMLLSISRFQRLGSWAVCIDCAITTLIYLFAIINTYHLHIELFTL